MRVLVVYGSSRGGTAGLAQRVAEAFVTQGILADVGDAADVDDLANYDAVVVGGALYNNRWHPDASGFVERNIETLRLKPVWFFSSGPLDDTARSGALAPVEQVQELARRTDIRGHMTFGGVLERRPSRFLSSWLAWGKPGDFRDHQQVDLWVERILIRLSEPPAATGPEATMPAQAALDDGSGGGDAADDDLGLDVLTDS